ncbi:MAG TPA: glycosyl hydrolase, partial [Gemmatirosa sp.]|nr:glycosyl hydrolase [Gemmatirosa sp.]
MSRRLLAVSAALLAAVLPAVPHAQPAPRAAAPYDSSAFSALAWREIGPFRGGRSVAVAGSAARPLEYWMGTTGGGVFKSTDGGMSWQPATDKHFGGTIGYIAVAESNPDVVYVGTGEYAIRGNVSHGEGVWKTTDAGKTWSFLGLKDTRQISRVRVHPTNPDIVYVAAQGAFWGPSKERGIYKSTDGGRTWQQILFRDARTGASDLVLDPSNPDVMYAAFWESYRNSWSMSSGGPGSTIMKSTDGGRTWAELRGNPGLPKGLLGNIGLAVSPANPRRLWAMIEADSGGVFRSDDAGATWTRTNDERKLRQRAWYYSRVFADPKDTNVVYALNVSFYRSADGGRTFKAIPTPHGDDHDLWIAPNDPQRMIEGNDGGANVSVNGGKAWTDQQYATAQFYHVTTTNDFPYKVCGAQQDNSTLCGPSRAPGGITTNLWHDAGGGESGYIAVDPRNPDVSFAGSYGGLLTRKDMRTGRSMQVNPWPDNPMGISSRDITYRFQWTFPILFSPHDPRVLYAAGNHVFRTTDEGRSWDIASPDLTRKDPKTMGPSGGPITRDQTGVETYATIFTLAESPKAKGVLWAGSDDGLVHVTRDGGATWANVTPRDLGDFTRVSLIDASPHDAAVAYLAANRYGLGDLRPILYKTADYGRTWTRIVNGIAPEEFTRAIREDPERRGLLYAATERGVW